MIEYDDRADKMSYMVFPDEDHGNTIRAFFPDGRTQAVLLSDPPFEVRDRGEDVDDRDDDEGEYLSSHRTEEEAVAAVAKLYEEWDGSDEDDDTSRYSIEDLDWCDHPRWFDEAHVAIEYVHTDGWRGHTKFSPPEGWETLTYGWMTGFPDETTTRKVAAMDVLELLGEGVIEVPVPIIWCFGVTSNVFSTSVDVFVPEGTKERVNEWLDGLEVTDAAAFDRAFT